MAVETLPAAIPPPGVESNFTNPQSLYPYMLATVVLCSFFTTLFTIARLCTKLLVSNWTSEDCRLEKHLTKELIS